MATPEEEEKNSVQAAKARKVRGGVAPKGLSRSARKLWRSMAKDPGFDREQFAAEANRDEKLIKDIFTEQRSQRGTRRLDISGNPVDPFAPKGLDWLEANGPYGGLGLNRAELVQRRQSDLDNLLANRPGFRQPPQPQQNQTPLPPMKSDPILSLFEDRTPFSANPVPQVQPPAPQQPAAPPIIPPAPARPQAAVQPQRPTPWSGPMPGMQGFEQDMNKFYGQPVNENPDALFSGRFSRQPIDLNPLQRDAMAGLVKGSPGAETVDTSLFNWATNVGDEELASLGAVFPGSGLDNPAMDNAITGRQQVGSILSDLIASGRIKRMPNPNYRPPRPGANMAAQQLGGREEPQFMTKAYPAWPLQF